MTGPIEFDTQRLRLRQWRTSDREPFAQLNADPRVMEFFPFTIDRQASDAALDRWQREIGERGWGLWAADLLGSHEFIGFVGLQVPSAAFHFAPCVEVGWRLARGHWGKGYATEAARGALRVGFDRIGLREIVSFTAVGNMRSRAVMERLGMQQDEATFEHPNIAQVSPLRDHCLYRITSAAAPLAARGRQRCGSGPCIRATSTRRALSPCGARRCWRARCCAATHGAIAIIRSWRAFSHSPRRCRRSTPTCWRCTPRRWPAAMPSIAARSDRCERWR
jgi:RimJ/RimL family protein N-acetyltransferase